MTRRHRSRGERGSVTVIAAAILFLCGVLVVIAVDLLRVLQARARAQTAADAAALAAAQQIARPSGETPEEAASEYATRNGATLLACRCDPQGGDATVEVQVSVDLVFLGPDRTVRALARAEIEGASVGPAGTMAANVGTAEGPVDSSQATVGPALPWGPWRRPEEVHGRGGLHAGQAGPAARLPPGCPLAVRDMRRPPRAASGRSLPGSRREPALSGLPQVRAPPARLRLRGRSSREQRAGLRGGGRAGLGRS
ncbi:MAG: hypothetical protein E6G44_06335 [Actinobacteria bacterium]|nr:MAG: hypothetical protein E6G44_06335 [Actinomycetota bacterium]